MKFNTKVIHAGVHPDTATGAIMTPIYQTSTYVQEEIGVHKGFEYSRTGNPTRATLENNLAAIEGGKYGACFGSGLAAIDAVIKMLEPGDEVILLAPFWVSYSAIVEMAEGIPVVIESGIDDNFKVKADKIEDYISVKTKMIILNSPNNPSGSMYSEDELRAIGEVLSKYPDIFILSDEIYEHINYGNHHFSFASIDEMYERTITINGVAKAFAMTGWRIGYIAVSYTHLTLPTTPYV